MSITAQQLKRLFPRAKAPLINAIVAGWPTAEASGIETPLRVAHFLAQIGTETGGLVSIVENLSYSAKRMMQVWPQRFPTLDSAKPYANNPARLAEKVYGGRLGNTKPGDGWRYIGRGMMQTTGRANYVKLGFESDPAALGNPAVAFATAVREWQNRGCNALADRDDLTAIRRKINGGTNGLEHARAFLAKAKAIFADYTPAQAIRPAPVKQPPAKPVSPETEMLLLPEAEVLVTRYPALGKSLPMSGRLVFAVQSHLKALKYPPGGLDGKEGPLTEEALLAAQMDNGCQPTGKVDLATVKAILGWKERQFVPERRNATMANVEQTVPEAATNAKTRWWGKLGTWFGGSIAGAGGAAQLIEATGTARTLMETVREYLPSTSAIVVSVVFLAILVLVLRNSGRAAREMTEAVHDGSRR